MNFKVGIRVMLCFNKLHSGEVEVMLLAAGNAGGKERQTLISRKVAKDNQQALRVARDFIDSRMDDGPPKGAPDVAVAPSGPQDGDLF